MGLHTSSTFNVQRVKQLTARLSSLVDLSGVMDKNSTTYKIDCIYIPVVFVVLEEYSSATHPRQRVSI